MDGRCLLVHLLRKGSTVTLWKGSHRYSLPYIKGENNLWLVPRASLKRFDLSPILYTFKQGGLYANAPIASRRTSMRTDTMKYYLRPSNGG